MGGAARVFPETCWSAVLGARDLPPTAAAEHLERLCRAYWKPVYWFIRRRWNRNNEDAKDLTQAFFVALIGSDFLRGVSPERGRFRSFVCAALQNFLRKSERDEHRIKRGGRRSFLPLDPIEEPEFELPGRDEPLEVVFDRLWAHTLLADTIEVLRQQYISAGRETSLRIFEARDLAEGEPPTYSELAGHFGVNEDSVRNSLRHVRADLRTLLRDRVYETLADPSDLESEIEYLFGGGVTR